MVASKRWAIENLLVFPAIAALVALSVAYDRRPPFEYLETNIGPQPAQAGKEITVSRSVIWYRQCEGEAWTELVTPKGYVIPRERALRYPSFLGHTMGVSHILLPRDMIPENETYGSATYRGVIKFKNCGFTSRLWPLEVPYQETTFQVGH